MGFDITNTRLRTDGGIRYGLLAGYPKISGDESKTSATEKYVIRASDLGAFYAESLPAPIAFLNFFRLPARRRMPGTGFLITKSLSFEPFSGQLPGDPLLVDPTAPNGTYDPLYTVTIQYETMQESEDNERQEEDPETFLEHSINAGGEYLSIPPTNIRVKAHAVAGQAERKNDSDPQQGGSDEFGNPVAAQANEAPIQQNKDKQMGILKAIPTIEHNLKWKWVLDPNWDRIYSSLGRVNDSVIDLFNDAEIETVLFTGVSGQQIYTWNGAQARVQPWSLDFKFSQRYINDQGKIYGWNHVYSPRLGEWVEVFRNQNDKLYDSADLEDLFKQ